MIKTDCRFPLAVQTTLPENYQEDDAFQAELQAVQSLGLTGVELNIADPKKNEMAEACRFLDRFDLKFTMLATGLTAKTKGLSLSSPDALIKEKSVEECKAMIDCAAEVKAGVIIGFLKGGISDDRAAANKRFADSLTGIVPFAEKKRVQVLVEATNRYESAIANSLEDAVGFLKQLGSDYLKILPDTFHMNIEESLTPAKSLKNWAGYYDSIHLSDNNRRLPGFGNFNFKSIFEVLNLIGYRGGLALEGNFEESFVSDLRHSVDFLAPLLAS